MTANSVRLRSALVALVLAACAAVGHASSGETAADLGGVAAGISQTNGPTSSAHPGDVLTYRYTVLGSSTGTTANTRLIGTVDGGVPGAETGANATILTVTGVSGVWSTAECAIDAFANGKEFSCTDVTGPLAGNSTVDITLRVEPSPGNDLRLYPPNCLVEDNGTGAVACTNSAIPLQTIDLGAPSNATTTAGLAQTFVFGLADGVTCQSDTTDNDGQRSCGASDVAVVNSGGATCLLTAGPTLASSNLAVNSSATVTIRGQNAGSCDVTLLTKLDPRTCVSDCTGATFIGIADPVTTLTYLPDADRDGITDASDNCPNASNSTQTNFDGDVFGNACDNCDDITNHGQENTDGDAFGDACEPAHCMTVMNWTLSPGSATDPDCDGFETDVEAFLGTDPNDACANTPQSNDEPDKHPADFNDDRVFNTLDLVLYATAIGKASNDEDYVTRADLNASGVINTVDLVFFASAIGRPCGP